MGTPITWDYDPPIVDTVSPNSGTTQGNTLLSITGTFDGVASVTISGKACLSRSVHIYISLIAASYITVYRFRFEDRHGWVYINIKHSST